MGENFINWTEALVDYFFSRNTEEEVFLYVDESILDQIGEEKKLGNHEDFINTFIIPPEHRISVYDMLLEHDGVLANRTPADNRRLNSNILEFASFLHDKTQHDYYFPYAVLVMYYASQANNRTEGAIGRNINMSLGINNRNLIVELFQWIHEDHPEFKNNIRTTQRIVGLIKYQLLLNPSEVREIQSALYRTSYEDDYSLTYLDKIRSIKNFVNDHVRRRLIDSLSNLDLQNRINTIFENFDLESYKKSHQNDAAICLEKNFALYLDFSERRGFRLLSNYRPEDGKQELMQDRNQFIFTPSIDSIETYNNEYVVYNNDDFVELREYSLTTDRLRIRPMPLGNVVFFYKYKDGGYVQSRNAYNRKVYIFVKKDRNNRSIRDWEAWAPENANNCRRIDENCDVTDLTQEHWALYRADGINTSYYTREDGRNLANSVRTIKKRGGIKCVGEKNVYLVNALPFFEFPNIINDDTLNLIIRKEDEELSQGVDYRYFILDNRLIIDLIRDIDYTESRKIEVEIDYTDQETGNHLCTTDNPEGNPVFYVRGQNVNYNQQELYRLNKWGAKIDNDEDHSIQGNIISGLNRINLGHAVHIIENNTLNSLYTDKFYFINLLASCVYMEQNDQITRDTLKKCIKYAATRLNINVNEDGFVTKVISLLVNSGYLAADYSTSHYQVIPPAFIKIPRSFNLGGSQVWMLTGTYTKRFLSELEDFCTKNVDGRERNVPICLKHRYNERLENARGHLKLLPPIVLVDGIFNPTEFKDRCPHHCFDVCQNNDYALELLSMVPKISDYRDTLRSVPRDNIDVSRFVKPKTCDFPRVREDNPGAYNNHVYIEESENGDFLRPTISEKWNDLYCYFKRIKSFIIQGLQHIYMPNNLILPSLIQRSLFIMNVGLPAYKKVFICDYPNRKLYTTMKSYKVNDNRLSSLYEKLTANSNIDGNPLIRNRIESCLNNRNNRWAYHMYLWARKEEDEYNKAIPYTLLVLHYEDKLNKQSQDVAVSVLSNNRIKTYVLRKTKFIEVNSDCVETMSFILKNRYWQYQQIDFKEDNSLGFTLPNKEKYNIEEITIL